MTWRYQPVYFINDEGHEVSALIYSMALIHVDAEGRLVEWAKGRKRIIGASMGELRDHLAEAIMAANLYRPVALSSLKVGMLFERIAE